MFNLLYVPIFDHVISDFVETVIGTHDQPIRAVEYSDEVNCILTGSWDTSVKMWDPRSSRCVGNYTQPDKVGVCPGLINTR